MTLLATTCSAVLALWVLRAAPRERDTFLFELGGTPVGTVELRLDPASGEYRYRSVQLFRLGAQARRTEREEVLQLRLDRTLPSGRTPESLALWRPPAQAGCLEVESELGGGQGRLCFSTAAGPARQGTLKGEPFRATYFEGRLVELSLPRAHFRRVSGAVKLADPGDVLAGGFEVQPGEGALRLSPAPPRDRTLLAKWTDAKAQALAETVHRDLAGTQSLCLDYARQFRQRANAGQPHAAVVHGLWVDGGLAQPHAWVRVRTAGGYRDLDPSSLQPVRPQTHLELGVEFGLEDERRVGRRWLEWLAGEIRVVRN